MKKVTLLSLMLLLTISHAKEEIPDTISVGLSYGTSAVSSFTVSADSGVKIDGTTYKGTVTIEKLGTNKLSVSNSSKDKTITVGSSGVKVILVDDDEFISYNGKEYRGYLKIYRLSGSDITVVNVVDFEEYLYGVVPREMSGSNPLEALKAQAVAARSYAYKSLGKYSKWNFDVTNTTSDQAYGGVASEHSNATKAVDKTRGEFVTYDGKIVSTPFFSTSSGYTESSENVWSSKVPYLVGVEDKYQSKDSEYLNWTVEYSKEDIEEILEKKGIDIGELERVVINERTDNGAVLELEFIGEDDSYIVTKEKARTTLSLKSQFYDISTGSSMYTITEDGKVQACTENKLKAMSSTSKRVKSISSSTKNIYFQGEEGKIKFDRTASASDYAITGSGWGHSVGMSQRGAVGMAEEGFDYEEILEWYYTGVKIQEF
ncbi:MAG: SpoIID/LytB domain-containing protein [Clostridiales bacterium]|nr:SpoIID/LytB domain-containing protein [Clostridiales bacterium]